MTPFIGPIIDIAGAAVFLYLYFSPKSRKFYHRKWLIAACLVWIGLAFSDLHLALNRQGAEEGAKVGAVADEGTGPVNGTAMHGGIRFRSDAGYSIEIPQGYRYSSRREGPVSLYAVRKEGPSKSILSVASIPFVGKLTDMAQKMAERLQTKHHGLRWGMGGTKNDVYLRYEFNGTSQRTEGLMRFVKGPKGAYVVGAIHRHGLDGGGLPKELKRAVESFSANR